MKTLNKIIYGAFAFATLLSASACVEKAPEYEPADPAGTSEVYFPEGLMTAFNLKDYDGKLPITVKRVSTDAQISVPLQVSADPIFTVPSSVSFNAGAATATFEITYDIDQVTPEQQYPISLTLGSETSDYGLSKYDFVVSIPVVWAKFASGHMYEVFWGEDEIETLYYQDLGNDIWYCYISNCFDTGGGAVPTNYYFYWDKKTNYLKVPMQWMGYTHSNGNKVYFSDAECFYTIYLGGEDKALERAKAKGFDSVADWMYSSEGLGETRPYYDGNGGFYLGDYYAYGPEAGDDFGRGFQFGGDKDYFIADGFTRTVDYNDDKHFGASSALYEGLALSEFFGAPDSPSMFEQSLRYDKSYLDSYKDADGNVDVTKIPADLTTTYYLTDYFGEGQCLAFTAPVPELLKEGSEVSDVENEQKTGVSIFGNPIFVQVKKGSFTYDEGDALPIIKIQLKVYSREITGKDDEGNDIYGEKNYDFDSVDESYLALDYGKDNYTLDDLYGGYLEDYLGTWTCYAYDYSDKAEYSYDVVLSDAGTDEAGKQLVSIKNLSGLYTEGKFEDEIIAIYDNYSLQVYPQSVADYTMKDGSTTPIVLVPFDPDSEQYYSNATLYVLGGICSDGALAFVSTYSDANLSGFGYMCPELGQGQFLTIFYNWYAPATGTASASKCVEHLMQQPVKAQAQSGITPLKMTKVSGKKVEVKAETKAAVSKVFSLSPVVKAEKSFEEVSIK